MFVEGLQNYPLDSFTNDANTKVLTQQHQAAPYKFDSLRDYTRSRASVIMVHAGKPRRVEA